VGKRILLVEDEEINRALVRTILRRSPAADLRELEVVEAASVAEARKHLTGEPFDALLVDVQLPDGSGLALAAEISAAAPVRPVIIALTGDASTERRAEAAEAGCDAFLDKPYAASALRDLLSRFLTRP
jgi:two-component system, OmpR family, KDP operon response regulator KdpE